ncbi:MAG TPA: DNA-directed RNA polymerase, subunit E'' [Candidatus Poseidoniaceae archaeon]|nr:DNA-directed RNA polymerase subunit E'' [Euryarchaeota archaeon]DAC53005.1 MAG TPA: DNA-directed RNA polymerase subunit E'' [Candidatus Poseidoniales archaeon]DAC71168.1 MAG TPA: DNA-directed RNA polymerase subunit E'' [Candidatus Poseidoniales archaeon]HII31478.1 DNA-directed RNA polymerase, subunit E'' [Candidatus Poseidoniaceae archaeon]|tara:strand:+ start:854 stop:1057 length:204 start_codon:yes stop_codon:yes gene_type:complete
MAKKPFACGECGLILQDGVDQCPRNPSAQTTTDWQGYVIIIHPSRSEIAERLNIDQPGRYALKVNIR